MRNVFSPILILVLVMVLVSVAVLGYKILNKNNGKNSKSDSANELIVPQLELGIEDEDTESEIVTIYANAFTDDEEGIACIILPNGVEIDSDSATYEVTENKTYTFKVRGNNGKESSLSIDVSNVRVSSYDNPYIPEGFTHTGGDVDNGFTIEDKYGNQYVWIPIPSGKPTRKTLLDQTYLENSNSTSAMVNSIAKNYGFYIARFEASEYDFNGTKVAASMSGKTPWTNISYIDANNAATKSAEAFAYPEGYSTAIVNSYSWDTTLEWIDEKKENYSTMLNFGNYSGQVYPTGTTESDILNNICDLAGNVREWTTEVYKGATETKKSSSKNKTEEVVLYRVIRGGGANLNKTASSHNGYPENTTGNYWGFRTILFKD